MDLKVTEHFNIDEFKQPARHNLPSKDYPIEWLDRLTRLCTQLEIIRAVFNQPIKIISGYRSEEYNTAIEGSKNSQHMLGLAADIVIKNVGADGVHKAILNLIKDKKLDIKGLGHYAKTDPPFNHVDIRDSKDLVMWFG